MLFLLRPLEMSRFCAAVASLLFAVHPVHTEAVSSVVGRAELLASGLSLGAFMCYHRSCLSSSASLSWLVLAQVIMAAGFYSKETGITISAVLVVYEWLLRDEWLYEPEPGPVGLRLGSKP